MLLTSVADPDLGSNAFYLRDPGRIFSGSRIFLTMTKTKQPYCKKQEKSNFAFHFSCKIRDGKMFVSRSGMKKMFGSGSGIQDKKKPNPR
jgi:hypothetical protein